MSEYIEIEHEADADPDVMHIYTNVSLVDEGPEQYDSVDEMAEGSPVAQALAYVEGIRRLALTEKEMTVTREAEMPWHIILAEVSTAIKEFFL